MLAKKHDPFVDLKEKRGETVGMAENVKKQEPRGPTIYIRNVDLPITTEDLNNSLVAEVKITPREIRKTVTNDKTETSYDLEITGIRFKS